MRLSNKKKIPFFSFLQTMILMATVFGVIMFLVERYKIDFLGWESIFFLIIPAVLIILYLVRGKQVFEYDSDGETLTFNNYSTIPMFKNPKKDEFPKYKLKNFEVANFYFVKKIVITLHSKKNNHLMLKYDISYLSNKEVKDLKLSLRKVLNANKESQLVTETV
ncbi:hypothetical protein [Soonwooa sp.]|uniref:hypothetical protein n=1 Tax=Soonwooa sp. TaxID=1938592 RepID=UPI00261CB075|nr:hypothetical protein [Soonwooa sp.]